MAIDCQDNKVELPCDCLPAPPPTPRPMAIAWLNGSFGRDGAITLGNSITPITYGSYPKLQANGAGQLQLIGSFSAFGQYVNAPTITINPPTAGVTATATLTLNSSRQVSTLTLTNAGSGYTPFQYYGYTISQEPLASSVILYTDLKDTGYWNNSFAPVNKVATLPPPAGWNPTSPTSLKCVFKISGAFRRDSVGSVRLRYKLNGTTQGTFMQIYQDTENTLTNFTHISKEITCNIGDLITYEIYTNDGAHIDYVGPVVGLFIPKLN